MDKKRINKYFSAIALGAALMAVPGCTDTWDEHYVNEVGSNSTAATKTLWELISEDPNLSKFAAIAEKAKFYKDDIHPVETYTYKNLLQSSQVCTVWAPTNEYFDDAEFQKWLDMCETDGYNVQQQFMANHIALWRHNVSESKIDTLKMINGKNMEFDKIAMTMQGVELDDNNIAALNGTLHTLKGITPFNYNFYEYLKFGNELKEFGAYLISKDTVYFNNNASIEGMPDENGNPTYVDSVYSTQNRLMDREYRPKTNPEDWMMFEKGFSARINAEDSAFIMLLPTDATWQATKEKLSPLYKYADMYEDRVKQNSTASKTPEKMSDYKADSLQDIAIKMDMVAPLVFNINKQPLIGDEKNGTPWTMDYFIETKGKEARYLLNMRNDTLRSTEAWDQTTLFNGEVKQMSNGNAYLIDSWNFPKDFYFPDVYVEAGMGTIFMHDHSSYWLGIANQQNFSNDNLSPITSKYGRVSKNDFLHVEPVGDGNKIKCEFKLKGNTNEAYTPNADVMSGKYDIYLVLVPNWYYKLGQQGYLTEEFYKEKIEYEEINGDSVLVRYTWDVDTAYIDSLADANKYKLKVQVRYNNNEKSDVLVPKNASGAEVIEYDAKKVDTVLVCKDFEFPYTYKNLQNSYPSLVITQGLGNKDKEDTGFTRFLNIDRIILKSKENNSEIVVAP